MLCRICGNEEDVQINFDYLMALCPSCVREAEENGTEAKMSRVDFEAKYWVTEDGTNYTEEVPMSTRREFYSDYLSSLGTFAKYVIDTSAS